MSKEKPATKICRHCKTEIPYDAKVCPQCRKKVKGGMLKWIIIAIAAIIIIGALAGGGEKNTGETQKIGEVSQPSKAADSSQTGRQEAAVYEQTSQAESAAETKTETESESSAGEAKSVYNVGDILKDGDMEIVYMSSGEYVSDNEFIQPADGNKYIFIQLAFRNTSETQDAAVSSFSFECYADGYSADAYYGGGDDLSATLSAGRSTSGYLYFEVPENAAEIEIEYTPNAFLDRKITFTYEGEQDSGYVLEGDSTPTEGALHVGEKAESKSLNIEYLSCFADESDNMFIQPKDGASLNLKTYRHRIRRFRYTRLTAMRMGSIVPELISGKTISAPQCLRDGRQRERLPLRSRMTRRWSRWNICRISGRPIVLYLRLKNNNMI